MKKLLFTCFLSILIFFQSDLTFAENKTINVTVESVGLSKRQAIREGLKAAVEEARGIVISSNTLVVDGKVVSDKSAIYSDGHVSDYKIVEENVVDKKVYLTINANVVMGNSFEDEEFESNNSSDNSSLNNNKSSAIKDNENFNKSNFKSIVELQIPKIIKAYEDSYEFRLDYGEDSLKESQNKKNLKVVPINLDLVVSINHDKYNNATAKLLNFLNKIGIRDKIGEYEISVLYKDRVYNYKMSKDEFHILKEHMDSNYRFFTVALLNSNKKEIDNFNIDKFKSIINVDNKSINIHPILITSNAEKYSKIIYADPKYLKKSISLTGKLGKRKDLGYIVGMRGEFVDNGFRINEVDKNSPAMKAGLFPKDVIVNINNIQINSNTELYDIINNLQDGYHKFEIIRDGQSVILDVFPVRRLNNFKAFL